MKYIVKVKRKTDRSKIEKTEKVKKVGNPKALSHFLVVESDLTKDELMSIPGVEFVEEECLHEPQNVQVQRNASNWFLGSASNTGLDYTFNRTGRGVAIYIMDSGIRIDHEDFSNRNISTVYSYDGLDYGGSVAGAEHGTMCASLAAGSIYGIAKEATIYNLRYNWTNTEGVKALDAMLAHYRENNLPAVLSMSFSAGNSDVYPLLFKALYEEGVVLVAAAGNYDQSQPTFPARRADVIAVAACDKTLRPSVWGTQATNYGSEVDIWAGGSSGISADIRSRSATLSANGTSAACPVVAGTIALILEGSKKLTGVRHVNQVKSILLENSRKDVIVYNDTKYSTTPNRYIYSITNNLAINPLDAVVLPDPEPLPDPIVDETKEIEDKTKTSNSSTMLVIGALILVAILAFAVL